MDGLEGISTYVDIRISRDTYIYNHEQTIYMTVDVCESNLLLFVGDTQLANFVLASGPSAWGVGKGMPLPHLRRCIPWAFTICLPLDCS